MQNITLNLFINSYKSTWQLCKHDLKGKRISAGVYCLFKYVEDQIIKRGCWNLNNQLNPATIKLLSQARAQIFIGMCRRLFLFFSSFFSLVFLFIFMFNDLRWEVVVRLGDICDYDFSQKDHTLSYKRMTT